MNKTSSIVIRNCTLLPELTEGTELRQADILIRGETICEIAAPHTLVSDACMEIDAHGKTLLPGLIDAHVHLFMGRDYGPMEIPTGCGRVFDCMQFAQYLLHLGFTTIRDMGDTVDLPTVALRNAIDRGVVEGPRIKVSGVTITPYESGFMADPGICCFTTGAQQMRYNVRTMLMNGADQIKIYGTGSMLTEGSEPGLRILEEDEIREAVTIASRKDTYVACHCHGAEAIETMIRCGVRTIEHASFITETACQMLDGRCDTGIVPTVGIFSEEIDALASEATRQKHARARENVFSCIRNAYENHNILIGWGTDISLADYKRCPYVEWHTRKEELGFQNIDLLKQATINSAKLLKMDDKIGSVKCGKLADLILVDGNPVDDITVMYKRPELIIKNGEVVSA